MDNSDLAKRMKEYESVPSGYLMGRTPVIIRIDGRAFHSFTRGFKRPFDTVLMTAMQRTTKRLCENVQGCVLGYTQSDEISLLLANYQNINSSPWFGYKIQKMTSIIASMATLYFNLAFNDLADDYFFSLCEEYPGSEDIKKVNEMASVYYDRCMTAMFDARCFNLPKEEVTNYFYWRQLDASRNSVQMVGQANFSHKELQNKSCNKIQDMLMTQKNVNWNDFPTYQKRGSCVIKKLDESRPECVRGVWTIDREIPIFKGDGRSYIDDLVFVGE